MSEQDHLHIHHADGRVELRDPDAADLIAALQPRSRTGRHRQADVEHVGLLRAVDLDGPLHPDLHARIDNDRERSPLMVAGRSARSLLGNLIVLVPILLHAHPGTKYGIPISGVRPRRLRHRRLEPAGADARSRRLRLVQDQRVDLGGAALEDVLRVALWPGWTDLLRT